MPRLEVRRPLTHDQMRSIAIKVTEKMGLKPKNPRDGFTFGYLDLYPVTYVHVFADEWDAFEKPALAVICPWCERDVGGPCGTNPHKAGCDRPSYLYSASECGQPDYDADY